MTQQDSGSAALPAFDPDSSEEQPAGALEALIGQIRRGFLRRERASPLDADEL